MFDLLILPIEYAYLFASVPFVVLWLLVFFYSPTTRKEQLYVSLAFALVGVFVENIFYFHDYWLPKSFWEIMTSPFYLFPEFILFGGAFAGITAVVYQTFSRKVLSKIQKPLPRWVRLATVLGIPLPIGFILFSLGVNSIFATALGAMAFTAVAISLRNDLAIPALKSGFLTLIIQFILYAPLFLFVGNVEEILASIWYLHGTSLDVRILYAPFTELFWGFSVGISVGVLYKFARNLCYSTSI